MSGTAGMPGPGLLGRMRHLHFMGAGGVGMCALAEVLLAHGLQVSGCDLGASERTERLRQLGARIDIGHDPQHLRDTDGLVITAAVAEDEDELVAARTAGLPVVHRAELLAELLRRQLGVAVAGTHGKTTTTAMITALLSRAGLDPTAIVGGRMRFLESHARIGQGPVMVCEADEFDRSFLRLSPTWAVITNVEPEHIDCYGSVDILEEAFVTFANRVAFFGAVIACSDDPALARLLPRLSRRVLTYGFGADAWLRACDLQRDGGSTRFEVRTPEAALGTVELPLPGVHNVLNALAALAVGLELAVPFPTLADGLASFSGVARRFQVLGERDQVTVVDDYAHHPSEVTAVLAAARQAFAGRRLLVVFQPHLFSRTRDLGEELGSSLCGADVVVVLPVYPAREQPLAGVDSGLVSSAVRRLGHRQVVDAGSLEEAVAVLDGQTRPRDVVLTVGAGNVHRVAEQWLGGGS